MENNTQKLSSIRLRELLNERCMSAQELSNKSGVSKASLSQYLSGKYTPKNITAKKLADVLQVNPAWIMGLDVPKKREDYNYDMSTPFPFDVDKISNKERLTRKAENYAMCITDFIHPELSSIEKAIEALDYEDLKILEVFINYRLLTIERDNRLSSKTTDEHGTK